MTELLMLQAALFQLRTSLGEDSGLLPLRISAEVLERALREAEAGIDASRVNDIEFALNDLVAAIDEIDPTPEIRTAVALMQQDVKALREAHALPADLVEAVGELQARLRERVQALERGQYRAEGSEPLPLPHPPEALREAAIPIVRRLTAAGFQTPILDLLIAEPGELRYHTINEIIDELDAILGS